MANLDAIVRELQQERDRLDAAPCQPPARPTQQLRSKTFRLQMDVWGLSQRHGEGELRCETHRFAPGMIQVRGN